MSRLPCTDHADLYDLVLFDDGPAEARSEALRRAAGLCVSCPSPCEQKVGADTAPIELVLLPEDWMPTAREGKPEPKVATPAKRAREVVRGIGFDYVRPDQRVAAWARMAGEHAARGDSLPAIAAALCVSESTAAALIEAGRAA